MLSKYLWQFGVINYFKTLVFLNFQTIENKPLIILSIRTRKSSLIRIIVFNILFFQSDKKIIYSYICFPDLKFWLTINFIIM